MDEWIKKMYIHIVDYIYTCVYSHTHKWRKKELLPLTTWMDLETIMLSEVSQRQINTV